MIFGVKWKLAGIVITQLNQFVLLNAEMVLRFYQKKSVKTETQLITKDVSLTALEH